MVYHDSQDASMTEVYYDWSATPDYCTRYGFCEASEVYYTLYNIDAEKIFAPDRQVITFPENTRIIRKKYSLSPAHQQFVRALLLETEWRGGLFDCRTGQRSHQLQPWPSWLVWGVLCVIGYYRYKIGIYDFDSIYDLRLQRSDHRPPNSENPPRA